MEKNGDGHGGPDTAKVYFFNSVKHAPAPKFCENGCQWLRQCKRQPKSINKQ
jgi:hypothetical protein